MWDRRKVLLAAIIFTALYYSVPAGSSKVLDMAPDAVDDLYSNCREEAMKKFIESGLLKQELKHSSSFEKAWNESTRCSKLIPGGRQEHTTALLAYDNVDREFIVTLNNEVETVGANVSTYENDFHFKSLHFLLMDYMMLQKPNNCKTVYIVPEEDNFNVQKGSKVRLGRFSKAEADFAKLKYFNDLDGLFVLNITSCFFAKLGDNICKNDEKNILLSPAEVFTVETVKEINTDDSSYTEIVLKHSDLKSFHNCYIFSRSPADVSTQWLVLMLVALSLLHANN
ncbi:T-cell ecto-ADP-ribosyltransferase 1 isoform X2 [Toxotes jaculatrix]|nr:T-cell ecto-ADP-ribosyltransferase 1 isoform X2 [Toxotes jaculatrix]